MVGMKNLKKDTLHLLFSCVGTQSCLSFIIYPCPLLSSLHPQPNPELKGKKLEALRRVPNKVPQIAFFSVPGAPGLLKSLEGKRQACL